MEYKYLGKTNLTVSRISLGTVSLGMDYGINVPKNFGCPSDSESIHLLQQAANAGINLYDTAPNYGNSETYLGKAIGPKLDYYIATKVSIPRDSNGYPLRDKKLRESINDSLTKSHRALQRNVIELVQIHNATIDVIEQSDITECLIDAQKKGSIRFIGASVYSEAEALAVINDGSFSTLQVAYNLLDQRMARNVFSAAERVGVGIIARSAFLKGALTSKAQWLPTELSKLKEAAKNARDKFANGSWQGLYDIALRFCLSAPEVGTVLIGSRTANELNAALKAAEAGPLPKDFISDMSAIALEDEHLINPSYWPVA